MLHFVVEVEFFTFMGKILFRRLVKVGSQNQPQRLEFYFITFIYIHYFTTIILLFSLSTDYNFTKFSTWGPWASSGHL